MKNWAYIEKCNIHRFHNISKSTVRILFKITYASNACSFYASISAELLLTRLQVLRCKVNIYDGSNSFCYVIVGSIVLGTENIF